MSRYQIIRILCLLNYRLKSPINKCIEIMKEMSISYPTVYYNTMNYGSIYNDLYIISNLTIGSTRLQRQEDFINVEIDRELALKLIIADWIWTEKNT